MDFPAVGKEGLLKPKGERCSPKERIQIRKPQAEKQKWSKETQKKRRKGEENQGEGRVTKGQRRNSLEQTEQSAVSSVAETPGQTRAENGPVPLADRGHWRGSWRSGWGWHRARGQGSWGRRGAWGQGAEGRGARALLPEVSTTVPRHEILLQRRIKTVL